MIPLMLSDNELSINTVCLDSNTEVAISAWLPDKTSFKNDYNITLTAFNLIQTLLTINYDPNLHSKKWNEEILVWKKINIKNSTDCINSFSLSHSSFKTNWKYILYIKKINENFVGYKEPNIFNLSKSYCLSSVFTSGPLKTAGAICPESKMIKCLQWRRLDYVGVLCKKKLTKNQKLKSSKIFCSQFENLYSKDCKCINRHLYHNYIYKKFNFSIDDFEWYEPCSSGYYLN